MYCLYCATDLLQHHHRAPGGAGLHPAAPTRLHQAAGTGSRRGCRADESRAAGRLVLTHNMGSLYGALEWHQAVRQPSNRHQCRLACCLQGVFLFGMSEGAVTLSTFNDEYFASMIRLGREMGDILGGAVTVHANAYGRREFVHQRSLVFVAPSCFAAGCGAGGACWRATAAR